MWTNFMDMHSGGGTKVDDFEHIYIEADKETAKVIFYNRFGHSPDRVSCTCCGEDYSIDENKSLAQLTGYRRNLRSLEAPRYKNGRLKPNPQKDEYYEDNYYLEKDEEPREGYEVCTRYNDGNNSVSLEEYVKSEGTLVIYEKDIKPEERLGECPEQGYIWQD